MEASSIDEDAAKLEIEIFSVDEVLANVIREKQNQSFIEEEEQKTEDILDEDAGNDGNAGIDDDDDEFVDALDVPSTANSLIIPNGDVAKTPTSNGFNDSIITSPASTDFFELLTKAQSDRLDDQRSECTPAVNMEFGPSKKRLSVNLQKSAASDPPTKIIAAPLAISSNGPSALRKRSSMMSKIASKFGKESFTSTEIPLEELCLEFSDSSTEMRRFEDATLPDDPGNELACQADEWRVEAAPMEYSTTIGSTQEEFEPADLGADYFRKYFYGEDHYTYVGDSEKLGCVTVSLRREIVKPPGLPDNVQYRLIIRSASGGTQRLVIPAESLSQNPNQVISPKELLQTILPDVPLHQAKVDRKLADAVLKMDECKSNPERQYKAGLMYCAPGQSTCDEMYCNENGSSAFEEFVNYIAEQVPLKGFPGFKGGLDVKDNQTGEKSAYTKLKGREVMFHVSTYLPFSTKDEQQVQRKRFIGNDIVTVIFQDEDAKPFDSSDSRSHYQHVFIVVRAQNSGTPQLSYKVCTVRKEHVPRFGPSLPSNCTFSFSAITSGEFRRFLLTKIINAESASCKTGHLNMLGQRTRMNLLQDIVQSFDSQINIGGRQKSLINAFRKDITDDIVGQFGQQTQKWKVKLVTDGASKAIAVTLAVSNDLVAVLDDNHGVLHSFPTKSVQGWDMNYDGITIFYGKRIDQLQLITSRGMQIADRLEICTNGAPMEQLTLTRKTHSQPWGFTVLGTQVLSVAPNGVAWRHGLTTDHRLFQINGLPVQEMQQQDIVQAVRLEDLKVRLVAQLPKDAPKRRESTSTSRSSGGGKISQKKNQQRRSVSGEDVSNDKKGNTLRDMVLKNAKRETRASFQSDTSTSSTNTRMGRHFEHVSSTDV